VGTPKRGRLAVVVAGVSKRDGIAIPEAPPKFWAQPPVQAELGRTSPGEVGSHQRPNMESETQLLTERQILASRSLDPTNDLMDWSRIRLDELMTDSAVVAADGFVDVGCCEPPSDFALALAVLSRSRLAVMVTELSKRDGIVRIKAPAKFLA